MSSMDAVNRRSFLKAIGSAGAFSALPEAAFGSSTGIIHEIAVGQDIKPKDTIKFAVCGMSHDHIYGMVGAIQRGGGVLVKWYGAEPDKVALFKSRFPDVPVAASEDEILNDSSVQLVLSSTIASHRAPLGVRVMKHGKDFLSDKPGITTLEQLAEVRKTIAETKRIYGIMYSELLEVKAAIKAGELVQSGAIGKVIQTINIAPHQIEQGANGDKFAGGASKRPDWFWDPELYGGILTDIGSHQVDQFLYYTGSTSADIVESQVANINHPGHPKFQDFGDMVLRGNKGLGYVRLDWFTPDGLGTWGDGRLFILGTEGYIECRKYTNVAVSKQGNNLFIVDRTSQRYIDCNNVPLPFGPQFVSDVVNRTHVAQDQAQCLLAAELVIKAQRAAKTVKLEA
ncbi:Gfo/Idh/MocA family protein [Granulicella sibirica]|uniref:Oxidoreductase-like n=1 Tax=Granulicella sibirica TaxID=2479048 RepID=A0A4Q0T7N0_9BACT|nr:Gfo/Idh/MocA family oxidoreductase [Granulicella sibirica]RXH58029.1 oxidoreductase-like [Granulicella sibirica]